jgi:hypothetical protein
VALLDKLRAQMRRLGPFKLGESAAPEKVS